MSAASAHQTAKKAARAGLGEVELFGRRFTEAEVTDLLADSVVVGRSCDVDLCTSPTRCLGRWGSRDVWACLGHEELILSLLSRREPEALDAIGEAQAFDPVAARPKEAVTRKRERLGLRPNRGRGTPHLGDARTVGA